MEDITEVAQTNTEMLGALAGAMGGGAGGGGGGDSGGCSQNTPAINIIDNARIMMLPGSVPGMMAQSKSEATDETEAAEELLT